MSPESKSSQVESLLFQSIRSMLADRGYFFPLAAAQRQFRDAYYGMSAAALLEDLFFDALSHYLHQFRPDVSLTRPERGQKGWDYAIEGTQVSHKVGRGPSQIAALWDATRTDLTRWSFESAILFTSSDYAPTRVLVDDGSDSGVRLRPVTGVPGEVVRTGEGVALLDWSPGDEARHVATWVVGQTTQPGAVVDLESVWSHISPALGGGAAANHLEMHVVSRGQLSRWHRLCAASAGSAHLRIARAGLRPGAYLFPRSNLLDVPVMTNNRAVLVSRATVSGLMAQAASAGLFLPLPTWFAAWAPSRPPDLFITQRTQFERMFSQLD